MRSAALAGCVSLVVGCSTTADPDLDAEVAGPDDAEGPDGAPPGDAGLDASADEPIFDAAADAQVVADAALDGGADAAPDAAAHDAGVDAFPDAGAAADAGSGCPPDRHDLDGNGSCEHRCTTTSTDDAVCNLMDDDCDGRVDEDVDTTSDPLDCGACGVACASPATCVSGTCDSADTGEAALAGSRRPGERGPSEARRPPASGKAARAPRSAGASGAPAWRWR